MKKDKEFEITEIDMKEMAHLIHVIPTPYLLRIAIGYEVILDKPFTKEQYIDLAMRCLEMAKEMKENLNNNEIN